MIRALALILGLVLGLAAAAAVQGRMAHLRALIPLPDWTAAIAADAGLRRGRAALPEGFELSWRLAGIGLSGPVWAGTIRRPDTHLDLSARMQRREGGGLVVAIRVGSGRATLDGPLLGADVLAVAGSGFVDRTGLWLDLDAAGTRIWLEGGPRADGPVNLNLWPGGWRLALGGPDPRQRTGTDLRALFGPRD